MSWLGMVQTNAEPSHHGSADVAAQAHSLITHRGLQHKLWSTREASAGLACSKQGSNSQLKAAHRDRVPSALKDQVEARGQCRL